MLVRPHEHVIGRLLSLFRIGQHGALGGELQAECRRTASSEVLHPHRRPQVRFLLVVAPFEAQVAARLPYVEGGGEHLEGRIPSSDAVRGRPLLVEARHIAMHLAVGEQVDHAIVLVVQSGEVGDDGVLLARYVGGVELEVVAVYGELLPHAELRGRLHEPYAVAVLAVVGDPHRHPVEVVAVRVHGALGRHVRIHPAVSDDVVGEVWSDHVIDVVAVLRHRYRVLIGADLVRRIADVHF